jgi:hypothetical protein
MVNRFNGVLKLHTISPDSKFGWVGLPWLILFSSFLINVFISAVTGGKVAIYTGGLASIFIWMLIVCTAAVNSTFPFALGLCIRRTDYFLGTALILFVLSLANAIVLCLFSFIETNLTDNWWTQLHFFSLPFLSENGLIGQFAISFLTMLHLCFLGFVFASIYRRYRMTGIYAFSAVIFLPGTVLGFLANYYNWWETIFNWIGQQGALGFMLWLSPLTLIYALVSHWMLHKATV